MKKIKLSLVTKLIRIFNGFFNEDYSPKDEANALLRIVNLEKDTKHRLESIKDLITVPIYDIGKFTVAPYLLINENKKVTNCTEGYINLNQIETLIYFDAKYFIECCNQGGLEDVSEQTWKGSEIQIKHINGDEWYDCVDEYFYRLKPKPNLYADIEALQAKAKELGIKLTIVAE